jgi:hypothetical protein
MTLFEHDLHDYIDSDAQLINQSIEEIQHIRRKSTDERLKKMHSVVVDLAIRAAAAVSKFRSDPHAGALWFERQMADI